MAPAGRQEHGFTLIELLVVAVLLAVMAGILYGSITGIMGGRQAIESQRETGMLAQFILERFSRDLVSREQVSLSNRENDASQPQSGFQGFSLRRYFMGADSRKNQMDADSLRFVTNNLPQVTSLTTPNFGLIEVEYRLEEPEESLEFGEEKTFVLVREERPAEVGDDQLLDKRTRAVPLADNVTGLNFRYLVGGEWQKDWQTPRRPLPEAVEVTLRLRDSAGDTQTFRTAYYVSKKQRGRL